MSAHINTYLLQGYVTSKLNLSVLGKNNEPKVTPCRAVVKIKIDNANFDGEELVGTIYHLANAQIIAAHKCEPENIQYGTIALLDITALDETKVVELKSQ